VGYVVIVGDEEVENNLVAIRDRKKREQYKMTKGEFVQMLKNLCEVKL
jgi:threonyl-tRNA synthetase